MEALRLFTFFLFLSITILGALGAADINAKDDDSNNFDDFDLVPGDHIKGLRYLKRLNGRFLAQQTLPANYTCNKYPRVCHLKGSAGKDCCKKKCVNVKTDNLNCGMCGYKCRHGQICCKGKCVNTLYDKKHCGGCNIKCKGGDFCAYGMCSYA